MKTIMAIIFCLGIALFALGAIILNWNKEKR